MRLSEAIDSDDDGVIQKSVNNDTGSQLMDVSRADDSTTGFTAPSKSYEETLPPGPALCHRAGIDALMTGFCFACYCSRLKQTALHIDSVKNHLFLSGKSIPLLVTKGNFGKVSTLRSSNPPVNSDPLKL